MQNTKQLILDTARNLFYTNGYETTSIQTIIDTVGIAKGTFYHHFSSKEDLLDQLIKHFSETLIEAMKNVAEDSTLNAVEKLNRAFIETGQMKIDSVNMDLLIVIMKNLYTNKNLLLRHKMDEMTIKEISPILSGIIRQGIAEKVFDTEYPEDMAELIMMIGGYLREASMDIMGNPTIEEIAAAVPGLKYKAEMYQISVERLLKAPEGSVQLFKPDIYEDFVERLKSRGGLDDKN